MNTKLIGIMLLFGTMSVNAQMIEFSLKHDIVSYRFNITLWDSNRIDVPLIKQMLSQTNHD